MRATVGRTLRNKSVRSAVKTRVVRVRRAIAEHTEGAAELGIAAIASLDRAANKGILHANNARDRSHDATVGKRTLATRLSLDAVVLEFRLLLAIPAVLLAVALATRGIPLWGAGAALPAAMGLRLAARARNDLDAMGWTRLLIGCVQLHMLTGATLAAGFVLSAIRW